MAERTNDRRARMRMSAEEVKQSAERGAFGGGPSFILPPSGVELWEPDHAGEYLLRIVPYQVTKPGHPDNKAVGSWHYRRPYGAHWNVGGSGQAVICLKDTFKQGDAVCRKVKELYDAGYEANEKAIKAHRAKRNCMFLVIDVKNDPGKVKIFDWSFSKFARELENKLKLAETEQLGFANAEGGLVLKVLVVADEFGGKKYFKVLEGAKDGSICPGIEFVPARSYTDLNDNILDQIDNIHLDEVFVVTPAEKIEELFNAGGEMGGDTHAAGSEFDDPPPAPTPPRTQPKTSPPKAPPKQRAAQTTEQDEFADPPPAPAAGKKAAVAPVEEEAW